MNFILITLDKPDFRLFLLDICIEPPQLKKREIIRLSRHEGGQAVYACIEGYVFKDFTEEMALTCHNMVWKGKVKSCKSKFCSWLCGIIAVDLFAIGKTNLIFLTP